MLSVLIDLRGQKFNGFLTRNGERLGINVRYLPIDVMILGPVPAELELGTNISYVKFQGNAVLASGTEDGEFKEWRDGLADGVQTLKLLDPRVYAILIKDGNLQEKDSVPIGRGLIRVFADYPTIEVSRILGMTDEVGKLMEAMTAGRDEVAFDFRIGHDGRPESMIRKELSPSADEIAVQFEYS